MKDLTKTENLLIVVDVINGFINEGNMADSYIKRIVEGIEKIVKRYISNDNCEVFYIRDCHTKDSVEFKKYPLHCLINTNECEMVEELKPYESYVRTYLKNSTLAMFAKGFISDLEKMKKLKKVTVVGCCSDICVLNLVLALSNYFDEYNLEIEINVIEDLIETYDSVSHNREKYNEMAKILIRQAGVNLIESGEM